jgi:hypothetical protein
MALSEQEIQTGVGQQVTQEVAPAPVKTLEEQTTELRRISQFRHKAFSELVGVHLDGFSQIMIATNGISFQQKVEASKALKEAIMFALDIGLDVTKAEIRQSGKLAKQTNTLAGVLAQTLDNRFLLLADKIQQDELNKQTTEQTQENSSEQASTESNV